MYLLYEIFSFHQVEEVPLVHQSGNNFRCIDTYNVISCELPPEKVTLFCNYVVKFCLKQQNLQETFHVKSFKTIVETGSSQCENTVDPVVLLFTQHCPAWPSNLLFNIQL